MKRTLFLVALALSGLALGQTRVWDNVREKATNSYGPSGTTLAFMGQADATQWTRWPERGPGIDFGAPQVLTEMTVYGLCNNAVTLTGNETVTVQIYANDGGNIVGTSGTNFNSPGTLLYSSPPFKVIPGDQATRIPLPSVAVPGKITWTLKYQGGLLNTGPFDPALNTSCVAGGRFWGSIPVANVQGPTGVMMRRVFTSGGASAWIAQERPATGYPLIPFCFGADFMSGDTTLISTPYDNGTNIIAQGGFVALGNPSGSVLPFAAAGNLITFEGTNRKVTQIDFGYYADTTASGGSPTYNIKFVKPNETSFWLIGTTTPGPGGSPDETQVIWDSGPQPIPLGQGGGGSGALQTVSLPVPNVLVPDRFCWIMTVTGLSGNTDDIVGPGILWGAKPGNCPNTFSGKDGTGQYLEYVIPPQGASGTFVFDTIAQLGPMKFTASAATSTETLSPGSEAINLGNASGGNLGSWAADDANARHICKFIVPNLTSPFVRVTLNYTTTKPLPTAIDFIIKAKMTNAGVFKIRAFLQNKVSLVFDQVLADSAINLSFATYTGSATGTLANYVGSGGAMTGRLELQQAGISAVIFPCADFEFANMKVTG